MAINFGPASGYNVFVFGNLNLSNTDAEGRVAAGGTATLSNYGIGASIGALSPFGTDTSFVVGGDMDVRNGSNASGNTVIHPAGTVRNYTMGNPNGSLIVGSPIDFAEAERYLKCASVYWNTLPANTAGEVVYGQLNLTGTSEILNVFQLDSTNLYGTGLALNQLNGINIIAPASSTILINVTGANILFGSYQIFRNGTAATRENARRILWNFPEALTWSNSTTAIYGSVLAPFAAASTTYSQINGNIVFASFIGNAESHNELFAGELPDPAVCLLSVIGDDAVFPTSSSTSSSSTSSTSSSTSSSTTTTTTTSTTSTTSTTTAAPSRRCQAVSDLLESVALQQTALSHILNAEGEKIQRILAFEGLTAEELLRANDSVEALVNAIANLEAILRSKLDLFQDCDCDCSQ